MNKEEYYKLLKKCHFQQHEWTQKLSCTLDEVRQTEKQKHCMMWNLKEHDINELLTKQKQTQRTNLQLPGGGEEYGEGDSEGLR